MKLSEEIKKEIDALAIPENLKWLEIIFYMRSYRDTGSMHNEDLLNMGRQIHSILLRCNKDEEFLAREYFYEKFVSLKIDANINKTSNKKEKKFNLFFDHENEKFYKLFSDLYCMFRAKWEEIPTSIIKTIVESYNLSNEEKDELIIYCISKIFQKESAEFRSRGGW